MIHKLTFCITNWPDWDHEINAAVRTFQASFSISPNIILCNRITLARMDIFADKKKIHNAAGEAVGKYQCCQIDGFIGNDYELKFCVDEKMADKCFVLIYDSDPGSDGEPIPDEDTNSDCFSATGTG